MGVYQRAVRPVLFRVDPERVHDGTVRAAEAVSRSRLACRALAARRPPAGPRLAVEVAGVRFANPLGLGAGFDKSARAVPALAALGFGHVEIGSVSAEPSAGNPRPRLHRRPGDEAVVVHYGVPNDGAQVVARRLARPRPAGVPLGVNVVSTNRGAGVRETDDEVLDDYVGTVARLQPYADYVCLNLSCPNTREGRGFFADTARLRELLARLGAQGVERPLFVKVAPFAGAADLEAFLAATEPFAFVSGFSVNLPPGPPGAEPPGAVSGPPAAARARETVRALHRASPRPVIGSGGVRTAGDAYAMLRLGASLVQLYTALVYAGPALPRLLLRDLAALLERDGITRVDEVVGAGA